MDSPLIIARAALKFSILLFAICATACSGGGGSSLGIPPNDVKSRVGPSATPAPAASGAAPTPAPSGGVPTPAATATPTPSAPGPGPSAYDAPAGTVPYFPTSPFLQTTSSPTVNPNSAAWVAHLGTFSINSLNASNSASLKTDHGMPIYLNHAGANIPVKIHCTATNNNTPCNDEGMTIYIDRREVPQNDDASDQDDHMEFIDRASGYAYDLWQVTWPPSHGILNASWSGRCLLSGNGFSNPSYSGPSWNSGCDSTASGTPISMGAIRAKDLLAAVQSGGTLPEAIQVAVPCAGPGPLPSPFLGSGDGKCRGYAPEGSHLYLAMHDSDVNALGVAPIVGVILRTLDEDHYGAYIVSVDSTPTGLQLQTEMDSTYTVWGKPGPWWTQFVPEAQNEGLPGANSPYQNRYQIQLPIPSSVAQAVRFS
jgi:hypothetical protein